MPHPYSVKFGDSKASLLGRPPEVGAYGPEFMLTSVDLETRSLIDYFGKAKVLNIFPSVDTPTCATAARTFNKLAASLEGAVVLCISKDLPFAASRFCAAEGLENVVFLSAHNGRDFDRDYGVGLASSPLSGLLARAVFVLDHDNRVVHAQIVEDIKDEPDYDAAMAALKKAVAP